MKLLLASTAIFSSNSNLGNLLIELIVAGLIFYLVIWFLGWVGLPEPFAKIAKVLIGLVVLIFLINLLCSFTGHPLFG
jgi:glycerol uptake facilitator-like aquaporin